MNANEREVRAFVSELRKAYKPLLPLRVYFRKEILDDGVQCNGLCRIKYRRGRPVGFSIFIRRASMEAMREVALHEYAHAMCWFEQGEDSDHVDDHGTEFGIWYARLYRMMFG